jgi:hypothetical protein
VVVVVVGGGFVVVVVVVVVVDLVVVVDDVVVVVVDFVVVLVMPALFEPGLKPPTVTDSVAVVPYTKPGMIHNDIKSMNKAILTKMFLDLRLFFTSIPTPLLPGIPDTP